MKRKCYFYNCGTVFDKNNKEYLFDCWNCNPNCCKSDLCNGLWCEDYGIYFNKKMTEDVIKEYVKNGVVSTYGFLKEVEIDLEENLWNEIDKYLIDNYGFDSMSEVRKKGFISFDFGELIEDFSSYWEQPDISYLKKDYESILRNLIEIRKEEELNQETISWINNNLYHQSQNVEKEMM